MNETINLDLPQMTQDNLRVPSGVGLCIVQPDPLTVHAESGEVMRITADGFVKFPGEIRVPVADFCAALRGLAACVEAYAPKKTEP